MSEKKEKIIVPVTNHSLRCPNCGRLVYSGVEQIDGTFWCGCGYNFYAFENNGLIIYMREAEIRKASILVEMRRFIFSTGRCQNMNPELLKGGINWQDPERDIEEDMRNVLKEFLLATVGECCMEPADIYAIAAAIVKGVDVEVKRMKEGLSVVALQRKNPNDVLKAYEQKMQSLRRTRGNTAKLRPAVTNGAGILPHGESKSMSMARPL